MLVYGLTPVFSTCGAGLSYTTAASPATLTGGFVPVSPRVAHGVERQFGSGLTHLPNECYTPNGLAIASPR